MSEAAASVQKVALTGATGFVGRHVAQLLAQRGHRVRCFVREQSNTQFLDDLVPGAVILPLARLLTAIARRTGRRPLVPEDIICTTLAGSLLFDGSKAERELGIHYTPLRTALAEAVAEIRAG